MDLSKVLTKLDQARTIAIDFETHSEANAQDLREVMILGIALAVDEPEPWSAYMDFNPQATDHGKTPDYGFDAIRPFIEDPNKVIVAHNAKYERTIFRLNETNVDGRILCTMMEAMLVNENRRVGLKDLVFQEFGRKRNKWNQTKQPGELFGVDLAAYANKDASDCLELHRLYFPQIQHMGLERTLWEIIMPSVEIASDMEIDGVRVDYENLYRIEQEYVERINDLRTKANKMIGRQVNLSSPAELSTCLFDELNLEPPTGLEPGVTGHYSTNEDVLKMIISQHPLVQNILEYRTAYKMLSTYVLPLKERALKDDGRIRPNWKPCRAETGRWRCAKPNLQNIPARKSKEIRKSFIASDGYKWISADFSQLELRIIAVFSKDPVMLKIYGEDGDIHQMTAESIGCTRQEAKAANFGLIYGMSPARFRHYVWQSTGDWISEKRAHEYHEKFFDIYAGIKRYHESIKQKIVTQGFVTTLVGRRRRVEDPQNPFKSYQQCINSPVQGSAADVLGISMFKIREQITKLGKENPIWNSSQFLIQVHDELNMETPESIADECATLVKECMESIDLKIIPLKADVGVGSNWAAAKE